LIKPSGMPFSGRVKKHDFGDHGARFHQNWYWVEIQAETISKHQGT